MTAPVINDIKCSITLTLQKSDYKLFEPVIVKVEVINQSKIAYDAHDLFSADFGGVGRFTIINDSGKVWNWYLEIGDLLYIAAPVYLLQPGDTFISTMPLNAYGNESNFMGFRFNQLGYFPSGKNYRAYYSDKNTKSNDVRFNVNNLNNEDSALIKIYSEYGRITEDSSISLIISIYPDNVFTEYLLADKLRRKWDWMFHDKNNNLSDVEEDCNNFFKKYPNSYSMYDGFFMCYYYARLFSGYFVPYSKIIKKIESSHISSQLYDFLNKGSTIKRIKYLLDILDDNLNWKTKRNNSIIIADPEYWR